MLNIALICALGLGEDGDNVSSIIVLYICPFERRTEKYKLSFGLNFIV